MSKSKRLITRRDHCTPLKIRHLLLALLVCSTLWNTAKASQEHSFSSILPLRLKEKKALVQKLQNEKLHWQKIAQRSALHHEGILDLGALKMELENLSQEIKALELANQNTKTLTEYCKDQLRAHRDKIREKAEGEKIALLSRPNRPNRKPFKDVVIQQVHDGGIKIRHSIGAADIDYENLPIELQKRFRFELGEAVAYRKKGAAQQQQLQIQLQKAAKKQPKAKAQPGFKQQPIPMPAMQKKTVKGRISVVLVGTDKHKWHPKRIKITAKGGSQAMRISGHGINKLVPANTTITFEKWVPEKYCISAHQNGELVDQESWKSKTGL